MNSAIFAGNRSGAMSRLTCVEIKFRAPHAIDATSSLVNFYTALDVRAAREPHVPGHVLVR